MNTIGFLLLGFILTIFSIDDVFINAVRELFGHEVSVASYYFIFLAAGLICDVLYTLKGLEVLR